jgi:hypothetical protein
MARQLMPFLRDKIGNQTFGNKIISPFKFNRRNPLLLTVGPSKGRDPCLQKRPRLKIQVNTEKCPKIWGQEQLIKNLVTMTEQEIFDVLSSKGVSDIKLTDPLLDQLWGALTKLALQSQSIITKYNF